MTRRVMLIFAVLGHPLLFGTYFCVSGLIEQGSPRFVVSLLGELGALAIGVAAIYRALKWLQTRRFSMPSPHDELIVHAMSLLYLAIIGITIANAGSLGLMSTGSRLDFYFENDWYRRIVTFSYLPGAIATYLCMNALLSPAYAGRRASFALNLLLLFAMSLFAGSKGAAVLAVVVAVAFVFSTRRLPVARIAATIVLTGAAYVSLFLFFTPNRFITLLDIAQRFYLSIDMSLFLQDRGTSELLSSKLGGVWTEIFRGASSVVGARVSDLPIGSLIHQQVVGAAANVGSNCRFGSLLLLYPDRLDFLVGFPLLVIGTAYLLSETLRAAGMQRSAVVAVPFFVFNSFQDVYWWASHLAPLLVLFAVARVGRAVCDELIDHPADAR